MPWSWSWNILGLVFASLAYVSDSKDADQNIGRLSSTLYTFQEHACSGELLKLRCPKDTTLSIQFAQYGRQVPSHQMCPMKPGSNLPQASQEEDTNCLATSSLEVVLKACQEKRHCSVLASRDTFGEDPCPGTHKYLEVAYKCRPNEFKSQLACEGQQLVLQCPKKKTRIALYSAMFGRTADGTEECPSPTVSGIDQECQSTYTLDEIMKRCHGRRQCTVEATEHIFGDPCPPRMKKYLHVIFTCVQKRILKELKREPTIRGHVAPDHEHDRRKPRPQPVEIELPDEVLQEPKLPLQTWDEDETGSSHTPNVTSLPTDHEVCNTSLTASNQFMIGFVSDWISTYNFIMDHREKAILYFVLGTCGGLVCLLLVIIVKIITHRQRTRKKSVDVTPREESCGRRLSQPPGAHHSLLLEDTDPINVPLTYNTDSVQSNHSDQGQGIEVIRYNSRVPLRTSGESGNRTLNHYYT